MNRNKKGVMPQITRETYKSVKKYDRQQFTVFCTNLYKYGYEDGRESVPGIDVSDIMEAISGVKGIGAKKLESIKAAIEAAYQAKEQEKEKMTEKQAIEIINDHSNFTDELDDCTMLNDARITASYHGAKPLCTECALKKGANNG